MREHASGTPAFGLDPVGSTTALLGYLTNGVTLINDGTAGASASQLGVRREPAMFA